MKCENCKAVDSYFDGNENVCYCRLGVKEEDAYHENTDTWSCKRSAKQIENKLLKLVF